MKHPHIATGEHLESSTSPRFRINTAPGVMEPTRKVNEAHGSYLQRDVVIELRDELDEWLDSHPPAEEVAIRALAEILGDFAIADEHNGTRNDMQLARLLVSRGVTVNQEEDR